MPTSTVASVGGGAACWAVLLAVAAAVGTLRPPCYWQQSGNCLPLQSRTPQMPVQILSPPTEPERVVLTHAPSGDTCEVYLHGATLTSWVAAKKERIFLSSKAKLDGSKAIRGGIPLVFPQFGAPEEVPWGKPLPQHGFARISKFKWLGTTTDDDSEVAGRFSLDETQIPEQARQLWPFKFQLIYTVTLKASSLATYITVNNTGTTPLRFTSLLHTYFLVPDVSKLSIHGLKGCTYADKTDGMKQKQRTEEVIKISGALDAVHENVTTNDFVLDIGHDPDSGGVSVHKDGFQDVVTWNPWSEGAKSMTDFGDEEYKKMACVEVGTVSLFTALEPGQVFKAGQVLTAR